MSTSGRGPIKTGKKNRKQRGTRKNKRKYNCKKKFSEKSKNMGEKSD
jgi:hypothetical protein